MNNGFVNIAQEKTKKEDQLLFTNAFHNQTVQTYKSFMTKKKKLLFIIKYIIIFICAIEWWRLLAQMPRGDHQNWS